MHRDRNARLRASSGLLLIMLSAITWGTVGVTTKALYGIVPTTPLSVGFFRLALAVPVLFLAGWIRLRERMLRLARRDLAVMAVIGAMSALYQVCYFSSIRHVGVAVATLITLCAAPAMVAILSAVLTRERPTARVFAALLCAMAGTVMLVGVPAGRVQSVAAGAALAMASALGYAVVTVCSRSLAGRCHPLQTVAVGFCVGAVLLLFAALPSGFVARYPVRGWALLAYLGLVPTALAYTLFFSGMRSVSATVASVATLLEPLTSTVLARFVFGERLGAAGWIGACFLGAAMATLLSEGAREQPS